MENNTSGSIEYMKPPQLDIQNKVDKDCFLSRQAKDYIVQDPIAFFVRLFRNTISLHDRESIGVTWNELGIIQRIGQSIVMPLKLISSLYWWPVPAIAAYGVLRLIKTGGFVLVLLIPPIATWIYFTLVHSVSVSGDRYHVPSVPFIAMVAA